MPLYVFKCQDCNKLTEAIAKVDDVFIRCPHCVDENGLPTARAEKTLTSFARYSIKGDNSASVTPRKFRKET